MTAGIGSSKKKSPAGQADYQIYLNDSRVFDGQDAKKNKNTMPVFKRLSPFVRFHQRRMLFILVAILIQIAYMQISPLRG
jgi:hypothetical protein